MFSAGPFALFVIALATLVNALSIQHATRDDNLPARVPYVFPSPGADPVADALRSRRVNGTLLDLDGVLLQDDNFAAGWNDLITVIRDNNTIPGTMRELMILRAGTLNNAAYVWIQHEPSGREAGLTLAQLREIRLTPAHATVARSSLSAELQAAMLLTDSITKDVKVPQATFDGLHKFLSDKQMVDAVGTAATYNLVARFVVALDVDSKANVAVPVPTQ